MRGLSNNRAGRHKVLGFLAIIFIAGCSYNTIESGMTEWDYTLYKEGWKLEYIDESREQLRWTNGTSINRTNSSDN